MSSPCGKAKNLGVESKQYTSYQVGVGGKPRCVYKYIYYKDIIIIISIKLIIVTDNRSETARWAPLQKST